MKKMEKNKDIFRTKSASGLRHTHRKNDNEKTATGAVFGLLRKSMPKSERVADAQGKVTPSECIVRDKVEAWSKVQ